MSDSTRIPDFDDMFNMASLIRDLQVVVLNTELSIDSLVDKITREVTTNTKFFVNGKAPSMEFVKVTYHTSGMNDEILLLRRKLVEQKSELDYAKRQFDIMRDIVTMYVTDSANKRASVV